MVKIIIALVVQASGEAADRRRLVPLPRLCLSLSCCQCLIEDPADTTAVKDVGAVTMMTISDKYVSVRLMLASKKLSVRPKPLPKHLRVSLSC